MNDYEKTIEVLQNRVRALEQLIQPVKWSPVGGYWFITIAGLIREGATDKRAREFGVERPTQQQAERAAVEMRRFNRLLALRDELCGDAVANWTDNESNKWILYFDNKDNEWTTGKNQYMQYVGVYFANEASAQKACDMLNSGEVEL
jgi:hypothetical protein